MKKMSANQKGFTLIELMIVIAILGIIATIAYPSYQESVKKTKRGEMMVRLQDLANDIEAQKVAKGSYAKVNLGHIEMDYPTGGQALYSVTASKPLSSTWVLTATPKSGGMMADDGALTLNFAGVKCRNKTPPQCGTGDEWRD